MLQIKNTLGGSAGNPEGLYVWKKYSTLDIFLEKYISTTEQKNTIFPYSSSNVLYKSSSYTFDKNAGIYTLVNPTSVSGSTLQDAVHMYNGEYFMLNANSGATMYKAPTKTSQDYGVTVFNSAYYGFGIQTYGDYGRAPYYIYSNESGTERTFISCIVANDESAYPNGAVHTDGYYYVKVALAYGQISLNSGETITIPHGLGSKPTFAIGYARVSNGPGFSVAFMYDGKTAEVTYANGYYLNVSTDKTCTIDETNITIPCASSSNNWGNTTYDWIAISA